MATTVNNAFNEFLKEIVNLDSNVTSKARASRNNLISNINNFSGSNDFFRVYKDKTLNYGSFARKTKIRELDDIDIMLCLSADRRTYTEFSDSFIIYGIESDIDNNLCNISTNELNSTKVINRFISKLENLNDYKKSEMHKNHEAATLQLKSYTWNFDIIPCFHTDLDFYLIPDGSGGWKKTDPRIDSTNVSSINQKHSGNVLNVIRLTKFWNIYNSSYNIPSYLLETIILNYYKNLEKKDNYWVDLEFRNILEYISNEILKDIYDLKGIQGNINSFSPSERKKISQKAILCLNKAIDAITLETTSQQASINKWREIFGEKFPQYTE